MTQPMGGDGPPAYAQPVVPWEAPEPVVGPAPGVEFAGHGARLVAYLIDTVLVTVALLVPFLVLAAVGSAVNSDITRPRGADPDAFAIVAVVLVFVGALVFVFGYFPFFWARSGQTPGMRPFRLWVVRDRDGSSLGKGTAILRMVGMFFVSSIFYLGFVWVFVDRRRRAWHDLIAGTVVIHRP